MHLTTALFHPRGALYGCATTPTQAVQQTYRAALGQYGLSGPTLFAPLINTVAAMAAQPSSPPRYFVLLILTDGAIMDMQDTIAAIVAASRLPVG